VTATSVCNFNEDSSYTVSIGSLMARLQYSRYLCGNFYRPRFKLETRGG